MNIVNFEWWAATREASEFWRQLEEFKQMGEHGRNSLNHEKTLRQTQETRARHLDVRDNYQRPS